MTSTLLTARDIANILRISRALAYRLIAQGEIPSLQFGRVSRVRQEDLDAFIQQCMRKPRSSSIAADSVEPSLSEKGRVNPDN